MVLLNVLLVPFQHHLTAAILLRRSFIQTGESLLKCSPDVLESLKTGLLTALQQEQTAFVRRKLCDTIAELARYCIGEYVVYGVVIISFIAVHTNFFDIKWQVNAIGKFQSWSI